MQINNPYFAAKKLTGLDLANTKTWLGKTTHHSAEIKGQWVARELYHLDGGLIGHERIFFSHDNEGKQYPKRPTYKQGYTGERTPAFTPIGCSFDNIVNQESLIIVGGFADAITVYNALCKTTVVLAIQGEQNTANLVGQLLRLNPDMSITAALDGDATGRRESLRTGQPWVTPDSGDWNDLYVKSGIEAVREQVSIVCEPLPSFSVDQLWKTLQVEVTAPTWDEFGKLTDPKQIAAYAMKLSLLSSEYIPARWNNEQAFINTLLANNFRITKATTDSLKEIIGKKVAAVKKRALSLNTLVGNDKHRHNYKLIRSLDDMPKELGNGVHILSASHGTGKTERTGIPFFHQSKEHALFICHLRSLVADVHQRINHPSFPVIHYEQLKNEVKDIQMHGSLTNDEATQYAGHKAVACCINSIVLSIEGWVKQTDTLLIDEVTQALAVVALAEYKGFDNLNVFNRLKETVRKASRVLVMDSDLDNTTIKFLEICRPNEQFNIYELPRHSSDFEVEWVYGNEMGVTSEEVGVSRILTELKSGSKLIIPTDSANRSKAIAELLISTFPDKKFLLINAETSKKKDVANFMREPNKFASQYDAVIHSPTLRSGVSITVDHFDLVIGLFCGITISPQDTIQMIRRARPVKHFLICVDECRTLSVITDTAILAEAQQIADIKQTNNFFAADLTEFDLFKNEQLAKKNLGNKLYAPALYFMLESYRFKINATKAREDVFSPLAAVKKAQRENQKVLIMESPVISEYDYSMLKNAECLCDEDSATLEAYKIREVMGVTEISEDTLMLWDDGRIRSKIKYLNGLVNNLKLGEDKAVTVSMKRFNDVKLSAFRDVLALTSIKFDANGVTGSITPEQECNITDYLMRNKILFAYLGLIPAKFADPKVKPIKKTGIKKILTPMLERCGLFTKSKKIRVDGEKNQVRVLAVNDKRTAVLMVAINHQSKALTNNSLKRNVVTASVIENDSQLDEPQSNIQIMPTIAEQERSYSEWEAVNNPSYSNDFMTDEMKAFLEQKKGSSFWGSAKAAEDNEFINTYNWKAIRATVKNPSFGKVAQRAAH